MKKSPRKERVKVTLILWRASPGGIEKSLFNYLDNLGEKNDFTIYSLRPIDQDKNLFSGHRANLRCGHRRNIILYWEFLCYALKNRDQVFHLFNAGPVILFILRLAGVRKIIYHIRGTIYWKTLSQKVLLKSAWRLALSNKTVFLANSEFSKKKFLEQISSKFDIEVLYNPFDVKKFMPHRKSNPGKLRILYAGRLAKGKNLFSWIDAAEVILTHFPQAGFRIVGDGGLKEELAARIKEKGLTRHISMTGYTADVATVYRESDLLLFLSEYESFGNVVVESILSGVPVIVSAIPSMKEIFKNFPEFLVELDGHLFQSIVDKLKNYDALRASAAGAREEFIKRFNLESHIERIKELYFGI